MGAYSLSKKGQQRLEIVCLATVISVTVALFSLPIIFHHVKVSLTIYILYEERLRDR